MSDHNEDPNLNPRGPRTPSPVRLNLRGPRIPSPFSPPSSPAESLLNRMFASSSSSLDIGNASTSQENSDFVQSEQSNPITHPLLGPPNPPITHPLLNPQLGLRPPSYFMECFNLGVDAQTREQAREILRTADSIEHIVAHVISNPRLMNAIMELRISDNPEQLQLQPSLIIGGPNSMPNSIGNSATGPRQVMSNPGPSVAEASQPVARPFEILKHLIEILVSPDTSRICERVSALLQSNAPLRAAYERQEQELQQQRQLQREQQQQQRRRQMIREFTRRLLRRATVEADDSSSSDSSIQEIQIFKRPRLENKPPGIDAASQTEGGLNLIKLEKGFTGLLQSGQFSDVVFDVRGKEFKVHKCIIAAHSPVFHAMLTHNMEEKKSGIIKIEDFEPDIFAELLNFMYTGSVSNIASENVVDLYTVAHKYDIMDLCNMCLSYMMNNVSEENFYELVALALQYSEKKLQETVAHYFFVNSKVITKTPAWLLFMKENTEAANWLVVKKLERFQQ